YSFVLDNKNSVTTTQGFSLSFLKVDHLSIRISSEKLLTELNAFGLKFFHYREIDFRQERSQHATLLDFAIQDHQCRNGNGQSHCFRHCTVAIDFAIDQQCRCSSFETVWPLDAEFVR